ncbi:DUF1552 domain-containing protein [Calycomorphotria hydatis]|uniref:DUF1552 domain-containing protein n=1 Tax=Calycomorphotria hydatis TaxID=2528027 RepID=A0A517T4K8_9PLAN|nr:DUF1552 domain-containing protein [Calycomorphotria hydatis]QDT63310.1 hypothetical protein V22_05300 [Calycomorphotria hydatis]
MSRQTLQRRTFLRGLGLGIALPGLEAMIPRSVFAASGEPGLATTPSGAPLRTAFLYIPNGVNVQKWMPTGTGTDFEFGETQQPLAPFRDDLQLFKGFMHSTAKSNGDGAGDHARSSASFLTGAQAFKTGGSDIHLGVSIDQVMAERIGNLTRFKSLELSCDKVRKSGVCDSGYSCAYQFNLSWRSPTLPMTPESNPRSVFERLFGTGNTSDRKQSAALRRHEQKSILDLVQADANQLYAKLGRNDRQKLDEYFTGVREVEQRIEKAERFGVPEIPDMYVPDGIPKDFKDHIDLMFDLLTLAFETDSTRVASFMLAHDGSNRTFKEIGVPEGHHTLSHHQSNEEKLEKIARIDRFYSERFAHFLTKMKNTADVDGKPLLDNSMIVYGSAISDGNRHNHENLPVILAGKGGGALQTGRNVDLGRKTPMTNLFVSMLNQQGIEADSFSNSDGRVSLG